MKTDLHGLVLIQLLCVNPKKIPNIHYHKSDSFPAPVFVVQEVVGKLGALRHVEKVLLHNVLCHLLPVRDDDGDEEVDHGDGDGQDHEDEDDQGRGATDLS